MDSGLVDQQKDDESPTSSSTLSAQQFYQRDPLLVLLKDKLRLNDLWIIAGIVVFPGSFFLFSWFGWTSKGRFWTTGDTLSALLLTFFLFPLLFMIYLLVPASIAGLFNSLRTNGVIGKHRGHQPGVKTYENFVHQMVSRMDNSWWTVVILVIVAFYALYRLLLLEPLSSSPVPYWMRVSAIVLYLPLMYATGMSVVRLLLALFFTNWLFYLFTIQVKPLHPDGSGGLGALGRILWVSVGIMLWEALLLSAAWLSRNLNWFSSPEMILLSTIYVTLTPALLIGWLVFPHRVMVRARDEVLQPLADEYQHALMQSLSSVEHDTRTIVAETRRLAPLKQRYDLVRSTFPTWPLEIDALGRLVVTVILPLLIPLIASLISLVIHAPGFP